MLSHVMAVPYPSGKEPQPAQLEAGKEEAEVGGTWLKSIETPLKNSSNTNFKQTRRKPL